MLPQYLRPHNVETPHGFLGTGRLNSRGLCAVTLIIVCACVLGSKELVALVLETQVDIINLFFFE
jgi:hypothetical protein